MDHITKMFEMKSDRELANFLGESPATLSKYRKGTRELSLKTKLYVLDACGYTNLREALLEILGEEKSKKISEKHNELIKKFMRLDK